MMLPATISQARYDVISSCTSLSSPTLLVRIEVLDGIEYIVYLKSPQLSQRILNSYDEAKLIDPNKHFLNYDAWLKYPKT